MNDRFKNICQSSISELSGDLSKIKIGRGYDVHSEESKQDWSTAYANMTLAMLRINTDEILIADTKVDRLLIEPAIDWLLANNGCASTGYPVWTLPYPRRIWEDINPCKPGTGFSVPTTHSIQAVVEYALSLKETSEDAYAHLCRVAYEAGLSYCENCYSKTPNGIVFWYSTLERHSFHVPNATAMMAGQIQNVAKLNDGHDLMEQQASRAIEELLCLTDSENLVLSWNYFGDRMPSNKVNRKNDILHEAFVCHGLMTYKFADGRTAGNFHYSDIVDCLAKYDRGGDIYDFPESEKSPKRLRQPARTIGVAHALYVIGELFLIAPTKDGKRLFDNFLTYLLEHLVREGRIVYRRGERDVSHYIRTKSHVILALSQAIKVLDDNLYWQLSA